MVGTGFFCDNCGKQIKVGNKMLNVLAHFELLEKPKNSKTLEIEVLDNSTLETFCEACAKRGKLFEVHGLKKPKKKTN